MHSRSGAKAPDASTSYLPTKTAAHLWFPVDGRGHWQGLQVQHSNRGQRLFSGRPSEYKVWKLSRSRQGNVADGYTPPPLSSNPDFGRIEPARFPDNPQVFTQDPESGAQIPGRLTLPEPGIGSRSLGPPEIPYIPPIRNKFRIFDSDGFPNGWGTKRPGCPDPPIPGMGNGDTDL